MRNLLRETMVTLVQKPLAKGGTDVFSGKLDMTGWNGCQFVGICSTINSTGKVRLRAYESTSSTATSTSDGFSLVDSKATLTTTAGAADGLLRIDVIYPRQRYLASKVDRLSAASEYAGTLAIQYAAPRMISTTKTSTDDLKTPVLVQPQTTGSTST